MGFMLSGDCEKLRCMIVINPMKGSAKDGEIISQFQSSHTRTITPSHYFQQYLSFFAGVDHADDESLFSKLKKSGIQYDPNKKDREIVVIKQIKASSNHQALLLEVSFGPFRLTITIFNKEQLSLTHSCNRIGRGAAGCIYEYNHNNQHLVVKCVHCQDYNSRKSPLVTVIQEYCFLKICSALEIGPKVGGLFGFDVVCFRDCIEFSMQRCDVSYSLTQEWQMELKHSLWVMHRLHIIHLDIKPDNLSFSPTFQKPIFLDFGFSKVINESVGEMKLLLFSGTMGYCSEEMRQAYFKQQWHLVDPYYNDVQGLCKSFEYFRKRKEAGEQREKGGNHNCYLQFGAISEQVSQVGSEVSIRLERKADKKTNGVQLFRQRELLLMRVLHELFLMNRYSLSLNESMTSILPIHHSKIAAFLLHLPPTPTLISFYHSHIHKNRQYDSQNLYIHFQKHSLIDIQPQSSIISDQQHDFNNFNHRINVLDLQISFLAYGEIRTRNPSNEAYKRLLKGKKEFNNIEEYCTILIEFIAFNRLSHHSSFTEKVKVSAVFLGEEKNETIREERDCKQIVDRCILRLVQLSLTAPLTPFRQYLFSMAFQQACILNLHNGSQLASLIDQIASSSFSLYSKIELLAQIDRCLLWLWVRCVSHRPVHLLTIKRILAGATHSALQTLQQKGRSIKRIVNYYFYQYWNILELEKMIQEYQKQVREGLGVVLSESQRNTLRLNLTTKSFSYSLSNKRPPLFTEFKTFLSMIFQCRREFFCSRRLILAKYFSFVKREADFQRLVKPLRAGFGSEFQLFEMQMMSLEARKMTSPTDLALFANHLIFLLKESARKRTPPTSKPFVHLILLKRLLKRKNMADWSSPDLFQEICRSLENHSDRYQKILISSFEAEGITLGHQLQDNAKYFLLEVVENCQTQRLTRVLAGMTTALESHSSDVPLQVSVYLISLARKMLGILLLMLRTESGEYQWVQNEILRRVKENSEQAALYYQSLVYIFQNHQQKRRLYAKMLYEKMKDFPYFYFKEDNYLIYYVLDAISQQSQSPQIFILPWKFSLLLSDYLYVHYSTKNFIKFWVSLRYFVQYIIRQLPPSQVADIAVQLNHLLPKSPYLSAFLTFLLPLLQEKKKRITLLKIAETMPKISQFARRAILKTYMLEIRTFLQGRALKSVQFQSWMRNSCERVERKVLKAMGRTPSGLQARINCRKYYNNCNSMQQRSD